MVLIYPKVAPSLCVGFASPDLTLAARWIRQVVAMVPNRLELALAARREGGLF